MLIRKIALLTDGVHPLVMGGMQKHSYFLLRSLLKRGVQVLLVHPGTGSVKEHLDDDMLSGLEEEIVPFPRGFKLPGSYLRDSFKYSLAVHALLADREDLDFIYAQGFSGWAALDQKKKGKFKTPIGVNFHGLEMFQYAEGFKQKLIQRIFRGPVRFNLEHADVAYSLGGKLTDILKEIVSQEKISVIPIALESSWSLEEEKKRSIGQLKFLFIGRYERRKGIEELNVLMKEDSSNEFHLVGPIPATKKVKKKSIVYHGTVMDTQALKSIIDDSQVLMVPSYSEGMPTVILEAMARGLVIIATDVGAVSELVSDENGFLIPPGDEVALREAVRKASELSPQEMKRMSDKSRALFLKNHLWDEVVERTMKDIENRIAKIED